MPNCGIAPEYPVSSPRDALTRTRPVGEAGVARAIGQAFYRRVTAKAEIRGARGADWPAASVLAQIQQGTAVRVVDRLVVGRSLEQPVLKPWRPSRAGSVRGVRSRGASGIAGFFAGQIETGELADHGVAAHSDVVGDFAAGQPGRKVDFQEFDAFGGPGGFVGEHVMLQSLRAVTPTPIGLAVVRTAACPKNPYDVFPLSRIDSSPSLMASRMPSSIRVLATPGTLVP